MPSMRPDICNALWGANISMHWKKFAIEKATKMADCHINAYTYIG